MIGKRIVSAGMAVTLVAGLFFPASVNAVELNYTSVNVSQCEEASYTSYDFMSVKGNPITLSVSGGDLVVTSDCATSVNMIVRSCTTGEQIAQKNTMDHSFRVAVADRMADDDVYFGILKFTADGVSHAYDNIYIRKSADGKVVFVKSPVYDFNVERCSELWTDADSLNECLQPQNDIECDDPFVISESNRITNGCDDDWSKVNAIYSYIINEFAYDNVQLEDDEYAYQDDAPTLLRRKIAICEGMANVFTALCRAQQIPAVVEFGVSEVFEDFANLASKRNNEWPNHAWAAVCIEENWYFMDPTFDCNNHFDGASRNDMQITRGRSTYNYSLLPLEYFSMDHKICDADTVHGIESEGSCGDHATYRISRDGTITISGSGEIVLPEGVNGFSRIVFDPDSNITSIGESCFIDCDLITEVILPDTVTTIQKEAFNTCEDLEYVYLPEGLTFIGREAFDICDQLCYVYVPDSVETIDRYAFDDCPRLIISVPSHLSGFERYNYVDPYRIIVRDN